jgi:hypothetical protein
VEGHGGDLEGQPRQDEDQPDHHARARLPVRQRIGQPVEIRRAGEAVDQRRAVQQKAEASAPSTKYFSPASALRALSRSKAAMT